MLDNEAVQALASAAHPKHHLVLPYVDVAVRRKRKFVPAAVLVPTSVRVEAGWDRTDPRWAAPNRMEIDDVDLDESQANLATAIRARVGHQVSVVDAHVGAVVQSVTAGRVIVITSDPTDMRAVAEGAPVVVVPI